MRKITELKATERVKKLREYYLNNSPMHVDKNAMPWQWHRSHLLYCKGFELGYKEPTLALRRCFAESYILENMKPVIIKGELIVGQLDYSPFTKEEQEEFDKIGSADRANERKQPLKRGRDSHLAMDYSLLFEKGVLGILEIIDEKIKNLDLTKGENIEKYEYYLGCKMELEGLKVLSTKYAESALSMANEAEGEEKQELLELYEVLKQVPLRKARTFREAIQSLQMFTFSLFGIYSFGKPDEYLYSFYKKDIESGILTVEKAQELVDCFYLTAISNMPSWASEALMLSGRDRNGNPVENEVTWHFLKAVEDTHIPDPSVGLCVTKETSEEIISYAAYLIKNGHSQPSIWNCDEVTNSMVKQGYEKSDAYMFTMSTCTEITPIGCSGVSVTSPYINALKVFLEAFDEADNSTSFNELLDLFEKHFRKEAFDAAVLENLWQLERKRNLTDPIRASVLIAPCIERGLSHDCGGAKYNFIQPNILGQQNVVESLNVIRQLVFEQKRITVEEFKEIIGKNYENNEALRLEIKEKLSHFGTDEEKSNEIAKEISNITYHAFDNITTVRDSKFIPGAFSYRDHVINGKKTNASPDGRLAGEPLNSGSDPVQGYADKGPTPLILSDNSWEPSRFLGGTTGNIRLNQSVKTESIISLIKTFLNLKMSQIQFTVTDTKTLTDAQKNPGNYKDLIVRIGGYSDFFVKLPPDLQNEVISRSRE